ncbi:MAG: fluoride efflux transporter CrcB [Flavobacteriaceae bacterium]|nr:fluoride efflux transporter CrcB [Flavobacteriaceae bacterium]
MRGFILIFIGGGLGSVFRFLISKYLEISKGSFPWATLIANFIGCFLIGLLLGWGLKNQNFRSDIFLFTTIGFCGGLTTFSSFSMENMLFLKSGDYFSFISYSLLSLIGGILFVGLGHLLFKLSV